MRELKRDGDPVYAIDSSTWIRFDEHPSFIQSVWPLIVALIDVSRLVTAPEVIKELRDDDYKHASIVCQLLEPYARQIARRTKRDQRWHDLLGELHNKHPGMCRTTNQRRRPADPYLLATAARLGLVVVSEESARKEPARKIPTACHTIGVKCITLTELTLAEAHLLSSGQPSI